MPNCKVPTNDANDGEHNQVVRKPYRKPTLTLYGDITHLTQTGDNVVANDPRTGQSGIAHFPIRRTPTPTLGI